MKRRTDYYDRHRSAFRAGLQCRMAESPIEGSHAPQRDPGSCHPLTRYRRRSCPQRHQRVADSFFATLKLELIYCNACTTCAAARRVIAEFIEIFYNHERMHSAIGYQSLANYEKRLMGIDTATGKAA